MGQPKRQSTVRSETISNRASSETPESRNWKNRIISAASDVIIEIIADTALVVIFGATSYAISWLYRQFGLTGLDLWISLAIRGLLQIAIIIAFGRYVWRVHLHLKHRYNDEEEVL
jgi:membrane protein implicated in regulation of membrane protease activity